MLVIEASTVHQISVVGWSLGLLRHEPHVLADAAPLAVRRTSRNRWPQYCERPAAMSRERCLFCDRFIFDGEDITRPAALGLTVHRQCYLRDAGLQSNDQSERRAEDSANDTTESDDW